MVIFLAHKTRSYSPLDLKHSISTLDRSLKVSKLVLGVRAHYYHSTSVIVYFHSLYKELDHIAIAKLGQLGQFNFTI